MKKYMMILALLVSGHAYAWDCNYWSQSSNPAAECYKPPSSGGATASATSTTNNSSYAGQSQGQHQGQTQSSTQSQSQGNTQALYASTYNPQQAPGVAQGSILISGCSAGGNAGGSNVHGAAFLGFGWTPHDCYLFYQAQAYLAVGERETACEVLNHTHAMQKLVKEGITLPACAPPVPPVVLNVTQVVPAPLPEVTPIVVDEQPVYVPPVHKHHHKAKVCPPGEKQ